MILSACSHKTTREIQQSGSLSFDSLRIANGTKMTVQLESLWIDDNYLRLMWGDSMTIPPLPPAPSFHYVLPSGSSKGAPMGLRPVLVRKKIDIVNVSDSVQKSGTISNEWHKKETEKIKQPFWKWSYLWYLVFVVIIALFVDFVWRSHR